MRRLALAFGRGATPVPAEDAGAQTYGAGLVVETLCPTDPWAHDFQGESPSPASAQAAAGVLRRAGPLIEKSC